MSAAATRETGKRVSWVELYLDLVFVLAVSELAHLIVATPDLHTILVALGLFVALWWTWVGFTVLYNRHGADDARQRALYLAASAAVGIAAVAVVPASHGRPAAFAASLAATRLLLVIGHLHDDTPYSSRGDALRRRTARAYSVSAALFVASIWLPRFAAYPLWAVAYLHESTVMLSGPATDADGALEAHHFAERFGPFMIILLGEVVVEAGESAADGRSLTAASWAGLAAAMVLAAALWWTYFAAAAQLDLAALRLSGGSPAVARTIFAVGHMVPAFGLLIAAAGAGLLLRGSATPLAYWLAAVGVGIYVGGVRAIQHGRRGWRRALRTVAMTVIYAFGTLHRALSPWSYLWLLTAAVVGNLAVASWTAEPEPRKATVVP